MGDDEHLTVIKINAITVPADAGDELAHRFAARAGAVDNADGFEGFELLKPADGREQWLVLTRWRDEESFQAWLNSDSFAHGHRSAAERRGEGAPPPVATHSEKPEEARARIERLYPGPYLELFARRPVEGWTTWGNEVAPIDAHDSAAGDER